MESSRSSEFRSENSIGQRGGGFTVWNKKDIITGSPSGFRGLQVLHTHNQPC